MLNRPFEPFDARKYLEFRLFWPYSSGLPGQWMSHQIDTVHWFSQLPHPRSASANGGIYAWKDGRRNADTMTVVFDYGPLDDLSKGFQVVFTSRQTNAAGDVKEIYYSNGGTMNLDTNVILFSMWTEAIKNFAEVGKGNIIFLDGSSEGMGKAMKQIQALMVKQAQDQ